MKKCIVCSEERDIKEFHRDSSKLDKHRNECKKCLLEKMKIYRENNKEIIKDRKKRYYEKNKERIKNKSINYYNDNKDTIKERFKEYYENNKEVMIDRSKEWYKNNKEYRLEYIRQYKKDRTEKDVYFRLRIVVSSIIRSYLKKNHKVKNSKTWSKIFYTPEQLKKHLESQFEPWMSWDNYGTYNRNEKTWQIDHVYPQSKLPYDSLDHPNFQKCWALENLRPLDSMENIRKGNKIVEDDR